MIKNIRALVVIAAMVLFPVSVFAEDVPMTEEEVYFEEDYAIEAQTEEEVLIVAEEDEFLEEDGLVAVEDDEELQAADDIDSGTCGENVNWKLDSEGTLAINGNGKMTDYSYLSKAPWYQYISDIKKVVIDNGVTSIGNYAFYHCENIQSITIPNSVTSIEGRAFYECISLTSITIPNSVTSIGRDAFSFCIRLKNIIIPNSVTSIGDFAFQDCSSLTSITILNSEISISKSAFEDCDNLTICAHHGSYAEEFAKEHNIKLSYIHTWDSGKVTKAATATSTGIRTYTCKICGDTQTEIIDKIKITPVDKITITKKPSIKKPTAKKTSITVKWKHFKHTSKKAKKIWKKIKKVEVQCATDSGFRNIVKTTMVKKSKTKAAIKGLNKKTTYYVRVRYFDGTGYSNWSKVKKIKTKK